MRTMAIFKRSRPKQLTKAPTLYAVLWWPQADHHIPELYGPFSDGEIALSVRDSIRAQQRREERMAQVVPFTG